MIKEGRRLGNPLVALALALVAVALPALVRSPSATAGPPGILGRAATGDVAPAALASGGGGRVTLTIRRTAAAGTTFAWSAVGTGAPLLLLNGTGSPMADWDPALLAALAQGRTVIVFDYPGLGLSGRSPGKISFAALADWTHEFMTATGLSSADVLGWSMGGFVAQQLAIRHPESVRRLVLAATNPGGPHTALGPSWAQEADSDPDATDATYLRTNYPATNCAQTAGRAYLHRLYRAIDSGRYPDEPVPARTFNAMVAAEDPWLRSPANETALRALAVRVMVADGGQDLITPLSNSRRMARTIPGASLFIYKGAGHSFLFQAPQRVARDVLVFLDGPATAVEYSAMTVPCVRQERDSHRSA